MATCHANLDAVRKRADLVHVFQDKYPESCQLAIMCHLEHKNYYIHLLFYLKIFTNSFLRSCTLHQ